VTGHIRSLDIAGSSYIEGRPDGSFNCGQVSVEKHASAELHGLNAKAIPNLAKLDRVSLWIAPRPQRGGVRLPGHDTSEWTESLASAARWASILRLLEDHHAPALVLSRARRSLAYARYLQLRNPADKARERPRDEARKRASDAEEGRLWNEMLRGGRKPRRSVFAALRGRVTDAASRLRSHFHVVRKWLRPSNHWLELYVLRLYRLIGFGESLPLAAAWYLGLAVAATAVLCAGTWQEGVFGTFLRVLANPVTLLGGDAALGLSSLKGTDLAIWYGFKLVGIVLLAFVALNIRRLATNRS
jgi:hypothetical protein